MSRRRDECLEPGSSIPAEGPFKSPIYHDAGSGLDLENKKKARSSEDSASH